MEKRGITLVELLVVVSVMGVLLTVLNLSFESWKKSYEVEKVTRELYNDLMRVRLMAIDRNTNYLTILDSHSYTMAEDRNQNRRIDDGEMLPSYPKTVKYRLEFRNKNDPKVVCNTRGLFTVGRTISVVPRTDADLDCMKISAVRIFIGKYDYEKDECLNR